MIPRISETELVALRSGNTHLDRQIMQGKVILPDKPRIFNKFPQNEVQKLIENFDHSVIYPNTNDNYWIII